MTPEAATALRAPFPPEAIGKLPSSNNRPALDYVGHAAVCDRLLQVDPDWTWEPPTSDELLRLPNGDGMWIKLTVCGVTRFGWGDGKNVKEWISDAIRNAAMRFGVALDLWSKEDLRAHDENAERAGHGSESMQPAAGPERVATAPSAPSPAPDEPTESAGPDASGAGVSIGAASYQKLVARSRALRADNVSVADARSARGLPKLTETMSPEDGEAWSSLLDDLESELERPFVTETAGV